MSTVRSNLTPSNQLTAKPLEVIYDRWHFISIHSYALMKRSAKFVVVIIVVLVALGVYWNYQVHRKLEELTKLAEPFVTACKSVSGCVLSPSGWSPMPEAFRLRENGQWVKTDDTASFLGQMEYVANRNDFELRWHIATDVYLVARGGISTKLSVARLVE